MFEELKTFIAVVEHNNFTKAAEDIKLSQPSVSLHIKHLEQYFNTVLIQRSIKQKNIVITPAGKILYDRSKNIMKLMDELQYELTDYTNVVKGQLKIGASYTIGEYFLPEFLGKFSKEYPGLKLEVTIENTAKICNLVENYKLDIGLIEGVVPEDDFIYGNFYEDKMVLAVPYNHELIKHTFSPRQLQNQTWISREEGSGTREYLNFFLSVNNINPKNIIVFGSNYSVKEAVKNDLGVTFISSYVAESAAKNNEISIIETNHEYKRNFSYILPKISSPSKATNVFLEKIISNIYTPGV